MKRSLPRLVPLLISLAFTSCGGANPKQRTALAGDSDNMLSTAVPSAPGTEARPLTVRVDPRVELFSMLFRGAKAQSYLGRSHGTAYEAAVDAKLEQLRDHPAIADSERIGREHGIGYNAPVGLAVYLDWPSLQPRRPLEPLPPGLDSRWEAVDTEAYLANVRDFVRDGNLEEFFAQQEDYFARVESPVSAFVGQYPIVSWFEELFGHHDIEHVVVQGLLTGHNNYGATVELPSGRSEAHHIVLLWDPDDAGVPRPKQELVAYVLHEAAHHYVNPRTARAESTLRDSGEDLFEHVSKGMHNQAYGSWDVMVNESLVRSVARIQLAKAGASVALEHAREQDNAQGFLWVGDLIEVIEAGLKAPGPFTYEAVLPRVAEVLHRWAHDEATLRRLHRFEGPINAVFDRDVRVVVPPRRTSPKLARYVRGIAERFGFQHVDATEVDSIDTAGSWVLYGTPRTTPLLRKWLQDVDWRIDAKGIVVDGRSFTGPNLVLIAAHPHPADDTRAVLVYAAHDERDLLEVNSMFHGPSDWLVSRKTPDGFEVIAQGDFPISPNP